MHKGVGKRASEMARTYDCVVRGGRIATASDEFMADIAIKDGMIAAIGHGLSDAGHSVRGAARRHAAKNCRR
jgi:dihydropyrimidinase